MATLHRWELLKRLNLESGYSPDDLAGIAELGDDIFHVSSSTISSWNSRSYLIGHFPTPVVKFRSGPVYSISEYLVGWNDWTPKRGEKAGFLLPNEQDVLAHSIHRMRTAYGNPEE